MRKLLPYFALIILPAVFLVIGLNFQRAHFSTDPEYAYLFNGLNVAHLKSVGHFDHPGSTVQMWNAAVLRGFHLLDFSSKDSLDNSVFRNPDKYIGLLISSILLLNTLLFAFLGIFAFRKLENLWLALILQLSPFLSSNLLEQAWTKMSPEPFLIAATSLFLITSIAFFTADDRKQLRFSLLFALSIAFGVATKVTFLPLAIIPLMVIGKIRNKIIYALACLPAFVLFTLPALPAYRLMARWFIGLGTHTGTYGQGSKGFIDPAVYKTNLLAIVKNNPAFSVSIAIVLLIFFLILLFIKIRKKNLRPGRMSFTTAILTAQLLGIAMVAKHYHMNHYLVPVLCLTGTSWVFVLRMAGEVFHFRKPVFSVLAVLLISGMLLTAWQNKPYLSLADHYYRLTNEEYDSTRELLHKDYKGYALVDYFPYSISPANGLKWGNVYARQCYSDSLKSMYPDQLFYDIYAGGFFNWETRLPARSLADKYGDKLLIVGGPVSDEDLGKLAETGLVLHPVLRGRTQSVFRIDTASALFGLHALPRPLNSFSFSMDTVSPDNSWFLAGTEKMTTDGKRSREQAHSGSFSARLGAKDVYGLPYQLRNVEAGQEYRVSVWRKGDNKNTFLVAAAEKTSQLYIQTAEIAESGVDGWNLISLVVTVPRGLSSPLIKIYVWNNSGKEVYFDDLGISRLK